MTELEFASDKVASFCDDIDADLSDEVRTQATDYARRADYEHPINRSPNVVAAASIYLAGLLLTHRMPRHKLTQTDVADACGVSDVALRDCYQELADYENITLRRTRKGKKNQMDSYRPRWIDQFLSGDVNE